MEIAARKRDRPTKVELLLAAEQLFCDQGIGATSLREIALKAGQRNTNAVKYHFASIDRLVDAITDYRVGQMEKPREELLALAEGCGRLNDARMLLEILCLPHLDIVDDEGRHSYAGFMLHYHQAYLTADNFQQRSAKWPNMKRLHNLLTDRINYVPVEVARTRINTCLLMFLGLLSRLDKLWRARLLVTSHAAILDDALDMMAVALCEPYRSGRGCAGYPSEARFTTPV